jgi:hypothetical protein
MLAYLKILINSLKEGFNYFKNHLYLNVMIYRHEKEIERRRVFKGD